MPDKSDFESDLLEQATAAVEFGDAGVIRSLHKRVLKSAPHSQAEALLREYLHSKKSGPNKIDKEAVIKIIQMYADGFNTQEIADQYEISRQKVASIVKKYSQKVDKGIVVRSSDSLKDLSLKDQSVPEALGERGLSPIVRDPSDSNTSASSEMRLKVMEQEISSQIQENHLLRSLVSKLRDKGYEFLDHDDGAPGKQINIRLSSSISRKIDELMCYWRTFDGFNFLDKSSVEKSVFDSPTSFSRFVLEAGIEALHIEYLNEIRIRELSERIELLLNSSDDILCFLNGNRDALLTDAGSKEFDQYLDLLKSKPQNCVYSQLREYANEFWPLAEFEALFDELFSEAAKRALEYFKEEPVGNEELRLRALALKNKLKSSP